MFFFAPIALLFSLLGEPTQPVAPTTAECKYELTFERTINGGDDSVYKLYCNKSGNSYTVYQRKNGDWERQGTDKKYTESELTEFMCDCNK